MALALSEPQPKLKEKRVEDLANKRVIDQVDSLLKQLNAGDTFDILGTVVQADPVNVVLTLDRAFLGDPSMSDLVDGEVHETNVDDIDSICYVAV